MVKKGQTFILDFLQSNFVWGSPLPNVTRHSGWWPHTVTPSIDRTLHQFWPLPIWTLLPNLTFYLIVQGFHRTYATGAACQQRTLTPPDTWSCPTLGLACVLMSRPIFPELVLSPDLLIWNTPRYFSFASKSPLILHALTKTWYRSIKESLFSLNINTSLQLTPIFPSLFHEIYLLDDLDIYWQQGGVCKCRHFIGCPNFTYTFEVRAANEMPACCQ